MLIELLLLVLEITARSASLPFLNRLVQAPCGPIEGITSYVLSQPVQTFLGVPYVVKPVGKMRFRKPEPLSPWSKTLIANRMPPACIQYTTHPYPWYDPEPGKDEDCLYLNIWAPIDAKEGSKKAVIFWIHGGGPYGSNRNKVENGAALAGLGDVILVSPNYRLGLFGFLNTGSEEVLRNIGIWDIIEALKWVRQNIESFGGDPNRVTLHGVSSGSFIITMLCVSPLTKGLFNQAIIESGSAIVVQNNPSGPNQKLSQDTAKAVGCATDERTIQNDSQRVVDCLREKDVMYLTQIAASFHPDSDADFLTEFGDELFPNPPFEDILQGRFHPVPLLIGNNKDEGVEEINSHLDVFGFFGEKSPSINQSYARFLIKDTIDAFLNCSSDSVADYYLTNISDGVALRQQMYEAVGEIEFKCPTSYFAESYADRNNNVYYYVFTHRPSVTPWAEWMGTVHYEEVQFVFGLPLREPFQYTQQEFDLSMKMVKTWTHFAKNGSPSADFYWPKFSRQNPLVVIIDTDFDGSLQIINPSHQNCNYIRSCFGF